MEISNLHLRLSAKLKRDLDEMCKEREISVSNHVRDLITNSVRTYKRQTKPSSEKEG